MPGLKDKVQSALDEGRILVLGVQVLVGLEYRSFFEPRFEGLPPWAHGAKLVALAAMLAALALIASPAAYHRLVTGGEDRPDVHRFTSGAVGAALLPFAGGLALEIAVAAGRVLGDGAALTAGAATAALALGAWYGATWVARARRGRPRARRVEDEMEKTSIAEKIRHVLTEARMVLPGAQALLGFQLAVTLMEPFDALPSELKRLHLVALGLLAVAVVLLMTPAAYHRVVERGEETERFHRVASGLVLAAMLPLALGLCADLLVVCEKVLHSRSAAIAIASGAGASFLVAWFGVPLGVRAARERRGPRRRVRAAAAHP